MRNWPTWAKFVIVLLVAILLPLVAVTFLIREEIRAIDLQNLQAYLVDEGAETQTDVRQVFRNASQELDAFANSSVYRNLLIRLVAGETLTGEIVTSIRTHMIERVMPDLFSSVRVLSPEGEVLLSTEDELVGFAESSNAYRIAQTASKLGETQRLAVYNRGRELVIDLIHVVYREGGQPTLTYAYVVGTLDVETAIAEGLVKPEGFIAAYTYLVTPNGSTITPATAPEGVNSSLRSPLITLLRDESLDGLATYTVRDTELVGHFAPIASDDLGFNVPFYVITEAPANLAFTLGEVQVFGRVPVVLLAAGVLAALLAFLLHQLIVPALRSLQRDIQAMGYDDLERPVQVARRRDEIGALARAFVNARDQLRALVEELEDRLKARSLDIQATQEISRFAATQRDLRQLMDQVVDRIVVLFPNIYHAQIFLIDQEREFAVLRASTGEAGTQLLQRGHRLAIGGVSVIGQVTENGRIVAVRETIGSDIHRRNEFLPETRAELAIPLRVGEQIIGALDVQSKLSDSFSDDQVATLQTMADQIAIAIENARLYQESVQRLQEITQSNRQTTLQSWREYMRYRQRPALAVQTPPGSDLRQLAVAHNEAIIGERTDHGTVAFAVPIQLRDQVIGAVEWEVPVADFNENKVKLAQELVNRLAISLENARLLQENRRTLERERLVNEIATELTRQTDVEDILQTAVREVGKALRAPQVSIRLRGHE